MASVSAPAPLNNSIPARISIPSLDVDAAVISAGITPKGELGTPTSGTEVAWFDHGPRPGAAGNAIFNGHVNGNGKLGVFGHLSKLHPGDLVTVTGTDGSSVNFHVTSTQRLGADARKAELFQAGGPPRITLITCDGAWDASRHIYRERLLVSASKVAG